MDNFVLIEQFKKELSGLSRDQNFAFASGMLTVYTDKFIKKEAISRLSKSSDRSFADMHQLLNEASYPVDASVEKRLTLAFDELQDLYREILRDEALRAILFLPEDYHNLKLFLKYLRSFTEVSKLSETFLPPDLASYCYQKGSIPPLELWQALLKLLSDGVKTPKIPSYLLEDAKSEIELWSLDYRLVATDLRLDKKRFFRMKELINSLSDAKIQKYLHFYMELEADLANWQMSLRCCKLKTKADLLSQALIPIGSLDLKELIKAYDGGERQLEFFFARTRLKELSYALRAFLYDKKQSSLSSAIRDLNLAFARLGLEAGYGIAKVFGFYMAKKLEIKNLRLIVALRDAGRQDMADKLLGKTYKGV